MPTKQLEDFAPVYSCSGTSHEVGCPHKEWSREDLQDALNNAKHSNEYLCYLLFDLGGIWALREEEKANP
jgi:hypothetical protein